MFWRICFTLFLCTTPLFANTKVLVSIAPQKFLVEEIGGPYVSVQTIVPPAASSHTYEPSAKQVVSIQKGEIWFRIGENFETRLIKTLPNTWIVDARENLELIGSSCGCCHEAYDPHIWLSPKLLKSQAQQIASTLSQRDPEHTLLYQKNLAHLEGKLTELDNELFSLLQNGPTTVLVSHPAFGYLCRDYGLTQLPIEMEGREPTPRYLTELILRARKLQIKTVFVQEQHGVRGGRRIAKELGAECVYLDPYKENVIENLKEIAGAFAR